jgi:Arc/MetJ-type ribon-helix-helix transcriptional regulator
MVMDTLQIRLSHGLVERVDSLVDSGLYPNRSDAVRDAVRRLVLDKMIGIVSSKEESVKQVRKIRTKLSNEKFDLDNINKLAD